MSEGHQEPPGDVRSFLPRPGEPVEEYAQRLRGLHRDLTLVLQAVERGLQAAAEPESMPPPMPPEHEPEHEHEPAPAFEPATPVHRSASDLDPPATFGLSRRGGPRVEVLPAPSGEGLRDPREERRGVAPEPDQDPPSLGPVPFPPRPSVRDAPPAEPEWLVGEEDPRQPAPPAPRRVRVEERPRPRSEREHPWVEAASGSWTAGADASPAHMAPGPLAPLLLIAALTGWLAVAALILALALD